MGGYIDPPVHGVSGNAPAAAPAAGHGGAQPPEQRLEPLATRRLDGTDLLDYHARMYDPVLARFVSADSVVPGSAAGSMDGVQLRPLTVDFHEPGFAGRLNSENGLGFWFQMSDDQQRDAGSPWGPANPQALNRYSYVRNAPVRWSDPSGHSVYMSQQEALSYANVDLTNLINWSFADLRERTGSRRIVRITT